MQNDLLKLNINITKLLWNFIEINENTLRKHEKIVTGVILYKNYRIFETDRLLQIFAHPYFINVNMYYIMIFF